MKKIILTILFMFLALPVFAALEGGVTYDVNSARSYVQEGQENTISIGNHFYYNGADPKDVDIMYLYNANGIPDGFVVRYKDDLRRDYTYKMNNKLEYIEKFDMDSNIYPHRGYKYNPSGNLICSSLTVSKGNRFAFSPNGKLLGRIVNGIGYLGNTNIVIGAQSNY